MQSLDNSRREMTQSFPYIITTWVPHKSWKTQIQEFKGFCSSTDELFKIALNIFNNLDHVQYVTINDSYDRGYPYTIHDFMNDLYNNGQSLQFGNSNFMEIKICINNEWKQSFTFENVYEKFYNDLKAKIKPLGKDYTDKDYTDKDYTDKDYTDNDTDNDNDNDND